MRHIKRPPLPVMLSPEMPPLRPRKVKRLTRCKLQPESASPQLPSPLLLGTPCWCPELFHLKVTQGRDSQTSAPGPCTLSLLPAPQNCLPRCPEAAPRVQNVGSRQSPWVSLARVISSRSFNTVWPAGTEGTGDGPISRRLTERRPNSHNLRVHGVASSAGPKRPECGSLSRQHCSGPAVGAAVCAAPTCRADQAASLSPHEGTQDRSCTPARRTSGDRALEGARRPAPPAAAPRAAAPSPG